MKSIRKETGRRPVPATDSAARTIPTGQSGTGIMWQRRQIVEKAPVSAGKTLLLKHLDGERLTASQRIKAKCCECMGYYVDGRVDCKIPNCPLYPAMPYRGVEKLSNDDA